MPEWGEPTSAENEMKKQAEGTIEKVNKLIHDMRINESIEETMQFIRSVNRYMEQQVPWKRVKEDKSAAGWLLITAAEAMRLGALLLQPVMPNRTLIVLETLNAERKIIMVIGMMANKEHKEFIQIFKNKVFQELRGKVESRG